MTSILTRFARLIPALALTSLAMTMKADTATTKTLFDFQAATHSPAWEVVNDDVMGGVSTSQFQVQTNGCAVFSGTVRLENNGGFASVRSQPVRVDLAGCDGFLLRVRGDGRRYKFSVRTETGMDTPLYQCAFTTKRGEWEEHRLPIKDFVPTFRGRILKDDILVESDGVMSRLHIYVTNAYLYAIEARSTRKIVTSADADRVFASFKFTGTALSRAPAAAGWTKFAPGGGRFSVHMPGSPVSEEQRFRTKGGDMVLYLFNLDRGATNGRFSVQYADYSEQFLKEARSADEVLKKASTVEAFNIGGKVVNEKDLPLGRYPGRELQVENAELAMRIRIYHERHLHGRAAHHRGRRSPAVHRSQLDCGPVGVRIDIWGQGHRGSRPG